MWKKRRKVNCRKRSQQQEVRAKVRELFLAHLKAATGCANPGA